MVVACALVVSSSARAQTIPTPASAIPVTSAGVPIVGPMLGPPTVHWLSSQGDQSGPAGDTHVPSFVLDPIRLGLFGEAVPVGAADPGCKSSREAETGSATAASPGFPMQHVAAVQLVPHLTLTGFARGGCAIDAGMGGALVYAAPVHKNVWFVMSTGILKVPHSGDIGTSTTHMQLRTDVVFARPAGRAYSVGISNRGVSVGGRY
jgi:hypothetical protein